MEILFQPEPQKLQLTGCACRRGASYCRESPVLASLTSLRRVAVIANSYFEPDSQLLFNPVLAGFNHMNAAIHLDAVKLFISLEAAPSQEKNCELLFSVGE
jgi:hypothetical protein